VDDYLSDPWRASSLAHAAVDRAAQELRRILKALAHSLDPFPNFLGVPTLHAVEVERGSSPNHELGCVVVGPDGELYELVLRMIPGLPESSGTDQVEELKEMDLELGEYVSYAHRAILQLAMLHRERQKGSL